MRNNFELVPEIYTAEGRWLLGLFACMEEHYRLGIDREDTEEYLQTQIFSDLCNALDFDPEMMMEAILGKRINSGSHNFWNWRGRRCRGKGRKHIDKMD